MVPVEGTETSSTIAETTRLSTREDFTFNIRRESTRSIQEMLLSNANHREIKDNEFVMKAMDSQVSYDIK